MRYFVFMLDFVLLLFVGLYSTQCVIISIDETSVRKSVNFNVFGDNSNGYNGCLWNQKQWQNCILWGNNYTVEMTENGNGIWLDSSENPIVSNFIDDLNITSLRFPGGCGAHLYDWREAVGAGRSHFLYGIEEWLQVCENHGIEPIFTLSYFVGTNDDLLELIRFLLSPQQGNRVRKEQYQIKYFEFGNEVYHGNHFDNEIQMGSVSPDDYATRYVDLRQKIKAEFPEVELGLIIEVEPSMFYSWNKKVLEIVGDNYDFCNPHFYPFYTEQENLNVDPAKLFKYAFAASYQAMQLLDEYLFTLIGDKKIAVTEYNNIFIQEQPVPYRYSFGNSLVVGDIIMNFLEISEKIQFANQWHLLNGYFGQLYNDDYFSFQNFFARPNYYSFKLIKETVLDDIVSFETSNMNHFSIDASDAEISSCCPSHFTSTSDVIHPKSPVREFVVETWNLDPISNVEYVSTSEEIEISFSGPSDFWHVYTEAFQVDPQKRYIVVVSMKTQDLTISYPSLCLLVVDSRGWEEWVYLPWQACVLSPLDDYTDIYFSFQPEETTTSVFFQFRRELSNVTGSLFIKKKIMMKEVNSFDPIPYLNVLTTTNSDQNEIGLVILNRNTLQDEDVQLNISKKFQIYEFLELHQDLDYVNEKDDNLKIERSYNLSTDTFKIKAHSLVGIKIKLLDSEGEVNEPNSMFWIIFGPIFGSVSFLLLLLVIAAIAVGIVILLVQQRKTKNNDLSKELV